MSTLTDMLEDIQTRLEMIERGKHYDEYKEVAARKVLAEELHDIAQRVLVDHMEKLAEDILRANPDVESVVHAMGLDFIRSTDGEEIPRSSFPLFDATSQAFEELWDTEAGVYVTRGNCMDRDT